MCVRCFYQRRTRFEALSSEGIPVRRSLIKKDGKKSQLIFKLKNGRFSGCVLQLFLRMRAISSSFQALCRLSLMS